MSFQIFRRLHIFTRMLQNRVDPYGNIIKTPARGAWMGNRGIIHDKNNEIVRPFQNKTWLTCRTEFKNRKLKVMAPNTYTKLFFIDEATAFAAGHRPCALCRKDDFQLFKKLWIKANPQYNLNENSPIGEIDKILHTERLAGTGSKITHTGQLDELPDGVIVSYEDQPLLWKSGYLYPWTPEGYQQPITPANATEIGSTHHTPPCPLIILTPASIIRTFKAGYKPQMAI